MKNLLNNFILTIISVIIAQTIITLVIILFPSLNFELLTKTELLILFSIGLIMNQLSDKY